jgi:dihydrofolate reductase
MRPQVSVFIATSLDGFIAREDGAIDWLEAANATVPPGEDCGYAAFAASVDGLVMGRHSFETVLGFAPWPYGDKRLVVLSRGPVAIPEALAGTVTASSEAPEALVERLGAEGVRHVYVDGGITIQRFMAAGLVDEITVTLIPILLGAGRPLFGPLPGDRNLTLLGSRQYDFGFVQLHYRVNP